MVNRIHTDTPRSQKISDNKQSETSDRALSAKLFSDDIISSLANAHENRRARQVTEWQRVAASSFRAAV